MKMPYINPLQCFVYVILWATGLSTVMESQHPCHRVKQEFVHRGIGSSHKVPDNPVYDKDISICFNAALRDSSEKTCCTRDMELMYKIAAGKYLTSSIKTKNAHLKKLVLDHLLQYQERIDMLVMSSENKTGQLLNDIYRIPKSDHHTALSEFYGNIRTYLRHKHVSIYGAVNSFFDGIFPFVYRNALEDASIALSDEHRKCLRENRQDITPPPFGSIPYNISHGLNRALSVSKLYVDVLSLIVEAINTTDHLNLTEKCQDHITRLQFCSQCQGHMDLKPCKGLCLNSMRRCLAQLSVISAEWSGLVTAMVRLEGGVTQSNNIERILDDLDTVIDKAILYAKDTQHRYYQETQKLCNYKVTVAVPVLPPVSSLPLKESTTKVKRSFGGSLYEKVLIVKKELLNSRKMFDTFADDICDQNIYYEQDYNSTTCWNGLAIGRYNFDVEDISTLTRTALVIDPSLVMLKDKLSHMRINLITRYTEYGSDIDNNNMMADSIRYGSGHVHLGHGVYVPTDDEDILGGSGSGSGEGSGQTDKGTIDVTIDGKGLVPNKNKKPITRNQTPENAGSHVTYSVTTALIAFITMVTLL